jgi:hypothetical protein
MSGGKSKKKKSGPTSMDRDEVEVGGVWARTNRRGKYCQLVFAATRRGWDWALTGATWAAASDPDLTAIGSRDTKVGLYQNPLAKRRARYFIPVERAAGEHHGRAGIQSRICDSSCRCLDT